MGIRDKVKQMGSQAVSRGIDLVAKRLYGQGSKWTEEERAAGIILSGSSKTAVREAEQLARDAGYQIKDRQDPALGITRPRAGRTFGARFDHYPILAPTGALPAKGSEAYWDLNGPLREPVKAGLADFKETLVLAFTGVGSEESDRLEDQLLELHPVLEPQTTVVFARLGNLAEDRLFRRVKLGETILTLPDVPMVFVFHVDPDGTLTYKCLAQRNLDASAPRFGILSLLEGNTYLPEGVEGTLEFQTGKTRHRSTAQNRYNRSFTARLDLEAAPAADPGAAPAADPGAAPAADPGAAPAADPGAAPTRA